MLGNSALSETALSEFLLEGEDGEIIEPEPLAILRERRPVIISGSNLYRTDYGSKFHETNIFALLERVGWSIDGINRDGSIRTNPYSVKIIREIWPVFRGTLGTELQISVGVQAKTPEDPLAWQGPFSFILGEDVSIRPLLEGVYFAIRITSQDQPVWSLLSMDIDLDRVGEVYAE